MLMQVESHDLKNNEYISEKIYTTVGYFKVNIKLTLLGTDNTNQRLMLRPQNRNNEGTNSHQQEVRNYYLMQGEGVLCFTHL